MNLAGVVLAGGKSRRFGSPKAFAKREGKDFYQYSLDALRPVVDELFLITNPELYNHFDLHYMKNLTVLNDSPELKERGPLSGLWTAMNAKTFDWYIVLPVDVPFMETRVLQQLVHNIDGDTDVVLPVVASRKQPLVAAYSARIKSNIKRVLDSDDYSVARLLDMCQVKYINIEEHQPFYNINDSTDFQVYIHNDRESK
ncbi:molybdenum cofactor guanylyltransferase [Virgibacillus sp. MSP4-1]|uniref:molybdenum cofactor guanylyltransferase n=1 Tax=Virgibacillus sp. MSP4-1 TaxID=2700081 RepID=UPI0003A95BDF|nr:molybdenum cofactor guanylyltransferase [Virgibacillus sp. MSP4-1]QHS22491.1 molybdenum cofactor guanylyltransferase [Virgibacillus sp. MSP4-1]